MGNYEIITRKILALRKELGLIGLKKKDPKYNIKLKVDAFEADLKSKPWLDELSINMKIFTFKKLITKDRF